MYLMLAKYNSSLNIQFFLAIACKNSSGIPESIGNLSSLDWLRLSVDRLSTLPESMEKLSSLTTIDLHSEKGTMLPPQIASIPSLERIYFTGDIANIITQGFKRDIQTVKTLRKLENNDVRLYIP